MGGPPGGRPQDYWSPRIAEVCHLRPDDLETMTLHQIHAAYTYSKGDG
jgi:hypothetical protein